MGCSRNSTEARTSYSESWRRALAGLLITVPLAGAAYALAYHRNLRRIVEQPDIAPADRSRPAMRLARALAAKLLSTPLERAVVLFTVRTIARSRQHRSMLAVYIGIGLAIAFAYAKRLLYGAAAWRQPGESLLAASLVLLGFAVIGARLVFTLPLALRANWTFRITAVQQPAAYFAAVRESLFAITVLPVCCGAAMLYFAIWPGGAAMEHVMVLLLVGALLVERSLYGFRKIPFTCAYVPGKADLKTKLGLYGIVFVFVCDQGVALELWAMERWTRFAVLAAILLAAAIWSWRRTATAAAAPYSQIQFEDAPPAEIQALDLRREGRWRAAID